MMQCVHSVLQSYFDYDFTAAKTQDRYQAQIKPIILSILNVNPYQNCRPDLTTLSMLV